MTDELNDYSKIIEQVRNSGLDSDQFVKIMLLKELRELNSNLREIDKTLMNLDVRTY